MGPCETALEVDVVRRFDRTVRAQFDGGSRDKRACGHDDLAVIAGHIGGLRGNEAVHRRSGLDSLAERDHAFGRAESDSLDDVVAALLTVRQNGKSERLIEIGGQDRPLEGGRSHSRSHEEALIEGGKNVQRGADLLSQSRGSQPDGRVLHALRSTCNITADRRKAAARVLDQGADDHVRADIGGLLPLHKFAVAVIDHADHVGALFFDHGDRFSDLAYAQCASVLIALGTLDSHQMDRGIFQRLADAFEVKCAVG